MVADDAWCGGAGLLLITTAGETLGGGRRTSPKGRRESTVDSFQVRQPCSVCGYMI